MDATLRSAHMQALYEQAMKDGITRDIATIKGAQINGLKILKNAFPMDLAFKDNDMLIDQSGSFWEFWVKLGQLIADDRLPYDQLLMNMKHKMSQPHVAHVHLVRFKDSREDFKL